MAKICVLTHTFPRFKNDTTAAFMHPLVLGLQKAGNKVIVLTPYHPQIKPNDFPYQIVAYQYIWPDCLHLLGYSRSLKAGFKLTPIVYLLSPFLYFFGTLALLRLCHQEKIDLVSSHWLLPNGFIALIVSRLLKIPYTVTLPGSDIFVAKKNRVFSQMAVMAATQAKAVIADSPQFLKDLVSLGAKIKKKAIIPYPVDVRQLKPTTLDQKRLRLKLRLKQNDLIIMSVARLVAKKGLAYLIKAAAPLLKKENQVKLFIIGDGDLKEELKSLVKDLKITGQTKFIYRVPREKMVQYYNLADIFVVCSIKDKAGNIDDSPVALFEAMACAKPVVATNFPGIAKVVKDKVSGFLVKEKSVPEIREALENLLQSARLRKKMGRESRRIAKEKLSIERIGERYTKVFFDIIKENQKQKTKNEKHKPKNIKIFSYLSMCF